MEGPGPGHFLLGRMIQKLIRLEIHWSVQHPLTGSETDWYQRKAFFFITRRI